MNCPPAYCACALLAFCVVPRGGQDKPIKQVTRAIAEPPGEKDLGKRAYKHVARLVACGPRTPGSQARANAADYICAHIKALGLQPIREAWNDKKEKLRFENIRVVLPGRSDKTLLVGTHYDTKVELDHEPGEDEQAFTGANDGGSGAGLMLAMLEDLVHLKMHKPTLEFVWFDGEESLPAKWNIDRALFGSKHFVKKHLPGKAKGGHDYGAFVLLDMVGHKKLAIDREETSTKALFPPIEAAVAKLGYGKFFFKKDTSVDDDHVPFLNAGLPSIDLIQFEDNDEWHTYKDTMDIVSWRSLAIVGRVLWQALPAIEARFLG